MLCKTTSLIKDSLINRREMAKDCGMTWQNIVFTSHRHGLRCCSTLIYAKFKFVFHTLFYVLSCIILWLVTIRHHVTSYIFHSRGVIIHVTDVNINSVLTWCHHYIIRAARHPQRQKFLHENFWRPRNYCRHYRCDYGYHILRLADKCVSHTLLHIW